MYPHNNAVIISSSLIYLALLLHRYNVTRDYEQSRVYLHLNIVKSSSCLNIVRNIGKETAFAISVICEQQCNVPAVKTCRYIYTATNFAARVWEGRITAWVNSLSYPVDMNVGTYSHIARRCEYELDVSFFYRGIGFVIFRVLYIVRFIVFENFALYWTFLLATRNLSQMFL